MTIGPYARLTKMQEYFQEKPIRKLYQAVIERFLTILDDEQDANIMDTSHKQEGFSVQQEGETMWPPWPWPPWDEDGDDDDGGTRPPKRRNLHKLAKKVVEFESNMAEASLDL